MKWKLALGIGCAQALALIPGASRSGTTLAAGLFLSFSRVAALRFSFLLSIPSIGLAGIYELVNEFSALQEIGLGSLLLSTFTAALSGYISIAFLLAFVQSHSLVSFALYRIALACFVLFYFS